ncbi:MAG: hypothetical protein D6714_16810, partial [Bacteroidetes bacterium]
MTFEILEEDEHLIAIHKPPGILVHRTPISEDTVFVLQLLRNQIRQRIYPVHRLDRGTSGVLVFAKNRESAGLLAQHFQNQTVRKWYWAVIRGYVEDAGTIDYPIAPDKGKPLQSAITHYRKISQTECPFAIGRYPTARYSFVEIRPETGRFHQIRRHFAHLRHPVINDKRHGDVKHNKFFRDQLRLSRLLLHAVRLTIPHPVENRLLTLE